MVCKVGILLFGMASAQELTSTVATAITCEVLMTPALGNVTVHNVPDQVCCESLTVHMLGSLGRQTAMLEAFGGWGAASALLGVTTCTAGASGACGSDPVNVADDATMAAVGTYLCENWGGCHTGGVRATGTVAQVAGLYSKDSYHRGLKCPPPPTPPPTPVPTHGGTNPCTDPSAFDPTLIYSTTGIPDDLKKALTTYALEYPKAGTCELLVHLLGAFSPNAETCAEKVRFGVYVGELISRNALLAAVGDACCWSKDYVGVRVPTVCNAYQMNPCVDTAAYNRGGAGGMCHLVPTYLTHFTPSVETCNEMIDVNGLHMTRNMALQAVRHDCCGGPTVCDQYMMNPCSDGSKFDKAAFSHGLSCTLFAEVKQFKPSDATCAEIISVTEHLNVTRKTLFDAFAPDCCGGGKSACTFPDLNNGRWANHDVNYYRRTVTKDSKVKLMELMGMNETNETELLLVTPLSEAPTPAPPTPAPTPVPVDVTVKVELVITSASGYNEAETKKAMGLPATADVTTLFKVSVSDSVNPPPNDEQAKKSYAIVFGLAEAQVTAKVTVLSGDGRRLPAGALVEATGTSSDASAIDAASAAAGNPVTLVAALKQVDASKFENVQTEQVVAPKTAATITVTDTAGDASAAANLAEKLETNLNTNKAAIEVSAGASEVVIETAEVVQQPTPMPTKMPTFMPTTLPVGATFAPTRLPTYMPTKMPTNNPTHMPTKMPTAMPTNMPTKMPTNEPTKDPTKMPTAMPTKEPTKMPTKMPTAMPTPVPPTSAPTMSPTNATEEESGAYLESVGTFTAAAVAFATFVAMQ